MAFVTAVTDVQDSTGATLCDAVDASGKKTRLPMALKLDPSLQGTPNRVGDSMVVTLASNGSGIVTTAAVQAAIAGAPISPSGITVADLVVTHSLRLGSGSSAPIAVPGSATTVGGGSATFASLAVPANSAWVFDMRVHGIAAGIGSYIEAQIGGTLRVDGSGSGAVTGAAASTKVNRIGLPPSLGMITVTGGALTFAVTGGTATVTSMADNGSGGTTITVTESLDTSLNGQNVTISGATGTTGVNGTHTASATTSHTFDVAVPFVATGTGSVASTLTLTWGGALSLT